MAQYNAENSQDITTFTGNLELGIAVLQSVYPHIRIVVASPTYAYAVDEAGKYISSDQYAYNGHDILSSYVIREGVSSISSGVSFLDNFYGTFNEDNASDYLTDNIHLNKAGRELVVKRCEYFLNYYIKGMENPNDPYFHFRNFMFSRTRSDRVPVSQY